MTLIDNGELEIMRRLSGATALMSLYTLAAAQDQVQIATGAALYDEHCAMCHGEKLRSSGVVPDLRELRPEDRPRFDQMVLEGRGQMPAWRGQLSAEEVDQIWAYIRSRAR